MDSPDLLYAPHGEPGRFFSPWRPWTTRFTDLLRWQLGKNPYAEDKKTPPRVPVVQNDGAYLRNGDEPPSVTWVAISMSGTLPFAMLVIRDPLPFQPSATLPRAVKPFQGNAAQGQPA